MNKETNSDILFSIKPKYLKLIKKHEKEFEYRNHYWKINYPSWFLVYESSPCSEINHLILLDQPYIRGEHLEGNSYGIQRFNNGSMKRKFAYPIKNIIELKNPIEMHKLKNDFDVIPPQNYLYVSKKKKLYSIISPLINNIIKKSRE